MAPARDGLRVLVGWLLVVGGACDRAPTTGQARTTTPESEVVARIDGDPITRADLDQRLADRSAFVRARYTAPDKRRELLDNVVRFEVLAKEAQSRGYDRDPEVVRHLKQRAVERMLAAEVDQKLAATPLPEAELQLYYRQHAAEFRQEEAVRVDQILIKDAALAQRVASRARALSPADAAGFRKLVAAHSEDEASRGRGGDLSFLQRNGDQAPLAVIDAAFAAIATGEAGGIGQIAGPIRTALGFHIIRVTQRRAGFTRPFQEVEPLVRTRIIEQRRREQIDAMVAETRSRVKVEVFQDRLNQLKVEQIGQDALAAPAPEKKP